MASKTTTTETSKAPEYAQPWLELAANDAGYLYQTGQGGNPWTGPTYAGMGDYTRGGVDNLYGAGNWDGSVARSVIDQSMSNPFVDKLDELAGGVKAINVDSKLFSDLFDTAGGATNADTNLAGIARGDDLGSEGNRFFKDALTDSLQDAAGVVQSQMAGAGRLGSGANTGVLAKQLGNISTQAMSDQFVRDQARQLQASGMIDNARLGRMGIQQGAAQGKAGVEAGNADRALSADQLRGSLYSQGGQLHGQGLDRALQASDMDFQNGLAGARAQIDAGNIMDADQQAQLDDMMGLYYSLDNAPWDRLNMLLGATQGAAGSYGTRSGTTRDSMGGLNAVGNFLGGAFGGKK